LQKGKKDRVGVDRAYEADCCLGFAAQGTGARAEAVSALLPQSGFTDAPSDTDLDPIHRAQAQENVWKKSLSRRSQHFNAINPSIRSICGQPENSW
jgi:hypothetical protein